MVHMLLSMDNMHGILRQLYTDMMTLCEGMTSVASGIAGLGALLYISYRVWQSLARGEAIDLFPLLRPFALGICIMFFPTLVLGSLNGILSPVVQATHSLMVGQTFNIERYMEQREALEREERERLPADSYYAEDPEMERELDALGLDEQTRSTLDKMDEERSSWSFKGWLMKGLAYILELAFAAAAVVIDALRTFYLVVLSILGPLAFAIAVFDGFQSSLTNWLSKYVSIYLWLPISDLFSAIIARLQILSLPAGDDERHGRHADLHGHRHLRLHVHPLDLYVDRADRRHIELQPYRSPHHDTGGRLNGHGRRKRIRRRQGRVARRQVGCRKTPGNTSITALHSLYGIQKS